MNLERRFKAGVKFDLERFRFLSMEFFSIVVKCNCLIVNCGLVS